MHILYCIRNLLLKRKKRKENEVFRNQNCLLCPMQSSSSQFTPHDMKSPAALASLQLPQPLDPDLSPVSFAVSILCSYFIASGYAVKNPLGCLDLFRRDDVWTVIINIKCRLLIKPIYNLGEINLLSLINSLLVYVMLQ